MNMCQSLSVIELDLFPQHRDLKNYYFSQFSRFSHNRTRMTRIRRIFTDPRASVSSMQSVFYRTISHLILYTKVNKTDNYGALKYKQEISRKIHKQPSITRKPRHRRRITGVWGSQPPAPLLKQTKSENLKI